MAKLLGVAPKDKTPQRPKVIVYGDPGVGKTWGSLDFPDCYYIDSESGADLPHYQKKLLDVGALYMGPKEGALDYKTVIEQVEALATQKHDRKTLVIDSLSKIYNDYAAEAEKKVGNTYSADKKEANKPTRQLIRWLTRLDMNTILICHPAGKWVNGEPSGTKPDIWDKMAHELHLVLEIIKVGQKRMAFVKKTRLIGFPDGSSFEWSYEEFSKRYNKDAMEAESVAIKLASKAQVEKFKELVEYRGKTEAEISKLLQKSGAGSIEELGVDDIVKYTKFLEGGK